MPIQDIANTADVQIFGDAILSADQVKFGSRSLKLDGDGDYVQTGIAPEFDLSGDFTIEGWIYPTTLSGNNVIASLTADGVNFGITTSGSDSFLTAYRGATALTQSSGTQVATGAWQFVSFSRASDNLVMSLDGVSVAQGTFATSGLSGNALRVGSGPLDSTGFAGFIDEFRVTKGNARYTASTFTVPDNIFGGDATMRARRTRLTFLDGVKPEVITIEVWGAGGGGRSLNNSRGGGGGYTTAQYTISGDQTLHILIGSGGDMGDAGASINSELEIGGGAGGARGGALTGVFTEPFSPLNVDNLHAAAVVIGGSGGGAAASNSGSNYGGQGGGSTGGDGAPQYPGPAPRGGSGHNSGLGGTQSAGGTGAQSYPFGAGPNAEDGGKLKGGASSGSFEPGPAIDNGGGGAGYYGGGGGGQTGPTGNHGSGGGGSGYFEDDDNNLPSQLSYVASSGSTLGGADGAAPGSASGVSAGPSDAPPAYGFGGSGPGLSGENNGFGGPGYVVITREDGSKTSYAANGTFSLVS